MKLNTILTIVLAVLIGVTFLLFVDEKPEDPRHQYLFSPIEDNEWSLKIENGELVRKDGKFLWNQKKVSTQDEDIPKVLARLNDLRIIRVTDDIDWSKVEEKSEFSYNDKQYVVSELNELTGRFMVIEKQLKKVYLIEDQGPLRELHKSFEVGQKIKYYNFLKMIKSHKWDL